MMDSNFTGRITATSNNQANITYKLTNTSTIVNFNLTSDFEMRNYTYMSKGNFNLTQGQSIVILGSNAFTNGSSVYFEI